MVRSASRSRFLFEHDPSGQARGHAFRKKPDTTHRVKARGQAFPDHALSDDTQPPTQHFLDFGRRQGRTEKETLHLVAAFRAQQRQLLGGLDAFRGRRYSETPAESGNGAHDRHRFAAGRKLADKGPVDLDLVERKTPQIAQR
jgi:hypothetical protein